MRKILKFSNYQQLTRRKSRKTVVFLVLFGFYSYICRSYEKNKIVAMKKRCFISGILLLLSITVNAAASNYKCLYAVAKVFPTGYGEVYLDTPDYDANYIKEQSEFYGDSAHIKFVSTQKGSEGSSGGLKAGKSFYGGLVYANPFDSYELVCYTKKVKPNQQYLFSECYAAVRGETEDARTYDFDYTTTGDLINLELGSHSVDGSSSDEGPSRDELLATESYWQRNPDDSIYVIFRKLGETYPKVVEKEVDVISVINIDNDSPSIIYDTSGRHHKMPSKGINIIKNHSGKTRKIMSR